MVNYTIPAIPTRYNGINFRSRLEAKWACFFDLIGWDWEYEPCDFNGWIPDFVIIGYKNIFVEVKPITNECNETITKIEKSGCIDECLLLGIKPFYGECHNLCIGWLSDVMQNEDNTYFHWFEDSWFCHTGVIGFNHSIGNWENRIDGYYDGDNFVVYKERLYGNCNKVKNANEILNLWNEASNRTQWQPRVS